MRLSCWGKYDHVFFSRNQQVDIQYKRSANRNNVRLPRLRQWTMSDEGTKSHRVYAMFRHSSCVATARNSGTMPGGAQEQPLARERPPPKLSLTKLSVKCKIDRRESGLLTLDGYAGDAKPTGFCRPRSPGQ